MSDSELALRGERVKDRHADKDIFRVRYNKKRTLVIDWNGYPYVSELKEGAQPSIDADSKRRMVGGFALRTLMYEGAYVGLGVTDMVPGTALDSAGGAALLGLAAYTAKKDTDNFRQKAERKIEKKGKKRERNPERIIQIPEIRLALVAPQNGEEPTLDEMRSDDVLHTVQLIREFEERYETSGLIAYVDHEIYEQAKQGSEKLSQERMVIYISTMKEVHGKKFKTKHLTDENYKKAMSWLLPSDFSKPDKMRLEDIEEELAAANRIGHLPPVGNNPTWLIDAQKIIGICAEWLNEPDTSPEVLADIYAISLLAKNVSNDNTEGLQAIGDALQRLVEHSLYATPPKLIELAD
jgi:hypothetical protein